MPGHADGARPVPRRDLADPVRPERSVDLLLHDVQLRRVPREDHARRHDGDADLHRAEPEPAGAVGPRGHPLRARRGGAAERQDARLPRRGLGRGRRHAADGRRLEAVADGRRRRRDGERELDAAVEQDGRHARLQLVRLLPEPVLVRHAGRVAARTAGRGLARRRHAVPGAAVAHGAATARTAARSCARSTAACSSRTRPATRGTSSSTSIRTSTRSRSRRAGSRSSPPTAASRARAATTWTSRPTATRATSRA